MQIRKNSLLESFHCLAGKCPDSCCKEWAVQVDDKSAALYRNLPGSLGDRLRQVLSDDPDAGTVMTIENGRCPMWQADGLCRIQAELGEQALCKTCRDFPRLTHDYGDFVELGLELSCPEAARLILTTPAQNYIVQTIPGGDAPEYDREAMSVLLQTRDVALALLQDDNYQVHEALILLLVYGYQAQALLDGDEPPTFDPALILKQAATLSPSADYSGLLRFFSGLEILTDAWKNLLKNPPQPAQWSNMFRNLACYGVERYWLQAISDYDLVGRVKMIVISCLMVKTLGNDTITTAQLYSKEIENDVDNIEAILNATYTEAALTDSALIRLLLRT